MLIFVNTALYIIYPETLNIVYLVFMSLTLKWKVILEGGKVVVVDYHTEVHWRLLSLVNWRAVTDLADEVRISDDTTGWPRGEVGVRVPRDSRCTVPVTIRPVVGEGIVDMSPFCQTTTETRFLIQKYNILTNDTTRTLFYITIFRMVQSIGEFSIQQKLFDPEEYRHMWLYIFE